MKISLIYLINISAIILSSMIVFLLFLGHILGLNYLARFLLIFIFIIILSIIIILFGIKNKLFRKEEIDQIK